MNRYLLLAILLLLIPIVSSAQDMKVKWEDDDGREFSIRVLTGRFEYSMVAGDDIEYELFGEQRVKKVGDTVIKYNWLDEKVEKVGDVEIKYNYLLKDRVEKIGGLTINYNYNGRITGTRGQVR